MQNPCVALYRRRRCMPAPPFYESLSAVDGDYETCRQTVLSKPEPKCKFVQPNTFLREDGTVELREYEASNVGIIQSFFEQII